ncbi:MAG: hypothetical protein L7S67_09495 [Flavobacteriales bacterium]|nr:hypothetical protein [Flavobacteriales bacterium]
MHLLTPSWGFRSFSGCVVALLFLLTTGCQQPAEEFEVLDITPVVAVPLVDTYFDLDDVLEALTDSTDTLPVVALEEGQLAFLHTESFSGTLAEEWLLLPDVLEAEELVLDENLAAAINLTAPGTVLTLSDTIVSEMIVENPEGALIDLIELQEGQLELVISSTMGDEVDGQLYIPNLLDPMGMPWSVAWTDAMLASGPLVVTEDLNGWSILPENLNVQDTNLVSAYLDVFVENDPAHTAEEGEMLSATFSMDGLVFERVEGDFGNDEIYLEQGTTTIALFDDRFTVAGVAIEQALISVEVTNGFGVEAILDSVTLKAVEDGVVTDELITTSPPLVVPPANGGFSDPSISEWFMDESNSNITSFFSVEPRELEVAAWITANPNGVEPGDPNFVEAEGYVAADLRVEVPLALTVAQLDFVDTLDVNLGSLEEEAMLDSASLRVILHNGFPFGVDLSVVFLDENGDALDSLSLAPLPLFTMPDLNGEGVPLEPAIFVHDVHFDWERADVLRAATKAVVQVWTSTAEASSGTFVYLKEDQGLQLELGAKLYTRISQ